jgi:hypothetical protein
MNTFKQPLKQTNHTLSLLQKQLLAQKRLLQCVRSALPEHLAQQVRHCLIRRNQLMIYTDSNAIAAIVRFYRAVILEKVETLRAQALNSMEVRPLVQAIGFSPNEQTRQANLPSEQTIDTFRKDSLAMQDEELKDALLSLSDTVKRKIAEKK